MEKQTIITMIVIGVLVVMLFIPGVSMVTKNVIGTNVTNDTSLAKVYVWNTEPNVTTVVISPSPIDLTPGNTTLVNCTAYIWDYNGWQDVNISSGVFYDSTASSSAGSDDNNYHYTNDSCSCAENSSVMAACTCTFQVWYYANNGTWACNMSAVDNGGNATERIHNFNSSKTASASVSEVLGIDTSDEIDYGNLSVTETSSLIPANVTNWGNIPINVSVRGYGGTDETQPMVGNYSMQCQLGNISISAERYSTNGTAAYGIMSNLTNSSTLLPDFNIPVRTNDTQYGNDTNTTYWRIKIPLTVGGICNGTVEFGAIQSN